MTKQPLADIDYLKPLLKQLLIDGWDGEVVNDSDWGELIVVGKDEGEELGYILRRIKPCLGSWEESQHLQRKVKRDLVEVWQVVSFWDENRHKSWKFQPVWTLGG